jgi:hypothetical protein
MKLAKEHHDGWSYCQAKTEFIEQIIAKAAEVPNEKFLTTEDTEKK